MNNIVHFFARFQRRSLLIAAAVLLLFFSLGRWLYDDYGKGRDALENKMTRIGQYQLVTRKAEVFDKRLESLLGAKEHADKYFFAGAEDDKLASAMQLRIQALVAKAGLQAESIRPTMQKPDGKQEKDGAGYVLGEVLIKVRLAGTIHEFLDFVADLYQGKEFFEIESILIKPQRKTGLKIFIELKGYYILSGPSDNSEGS